MKHYLILSHNIPDKDFALGEFWESVSKVVGASWKIGNDEVRVNNISYLFRLYSDDILSLIDYDILGILTTDGKYSFFQLEYDPEALLM